MSWSSHGARLTGYLVTASGRPAGIGVYDFAAGRRRRLDPTMAHAVKWLNDGRRVVYFTRNGNVARRPRLQLWKS